MATILVRKPPEGTEIHRDGEWVIYMVTVGEESFVKLHDSGYDVFSVRKVKLDQLIQLLVDAREKMEK